MASMLGSGTGVKLCYEDSVALYLNSGLITESRSVLVACRNLLVYLRLATEYLRVTRLDLVHTIKSQYMGCFIQEIALGDP